jgi:DNA-directed RNA polymerase specialized sigma24 family protein
LAETASAGGRGVFVECDEPARGEAHRDRPGIRAGADALARLPADYAEIILLRNVEGLSHEQAAERMGRGVGAVRMLWVRALSRLRAELDLRENPGRSRDEPSR